MDKKILSDVRKVFPTVALNIHGDLTLQHPGFDKAFYIHESQVSRYKEVINSVDSDERDNAKRAITRDIISMFTSAILNYQTP